MIDKSLVRKVASIIKALNFQFPQMPERIHLNASFMCQHICDINETKEILDELVLLGLAQKDSNGLIEIIKEK